MRISNAENPLDASAVHPEAYTLVERIAKQNSRDVKGLIGDSATLKALKPADFADEISLVGPPARIRERLAAWEDSAVTMLNIGARSVADLRTAAELILG